MVKQRTCICMAKITVNVIVLATLIHQSITAVEIGTHTLLKYETTLHSNGESNASSLDSHMLCSYQYGKILTCQQGEPLLTAGYCATYNDHTKLVSILERPFFESNGYNYTSQGSVLLPKNLNELNNYMCGCDGVTESQPWPDCPALRTTIEHNN